MNHYVKTNIAFNIELLYQFFLLLFIPQTWFNQCLYLLSVQVWAHACTVSDEVWYSNNKASFTVYIMFNFTNEQFEIECFNY